MNFKDLKKAIEEKEGKTQKELAKALGHSDPTAVSKMLGGKRLCKVDEIAPLLAYIESDYVVFDHIISFKLPDSIDNTNLEHMSLFIAAVGLSKEEKKDAG